MATKKWYKIEVDPRLERDDDLATLIRENTEVLEDLFKDTFVPVTMRWELGKIDTLGQDQIMLRLSFENDAKERAFSPAELRSPEERRSDYLSLSQAFLQARSKRLLAEMYEE